MKKSDKKKTIFCFFFLSFLLLTTSISPALAGPQTTNYELQEYGFGSGGTSNSSTDNYNLFGTSGEVDQGIGSTDNYQTLPGLTYTIRATVPPAPTFTNPDNYYNKLHFVLNIGDNESDAEYALAISTDNFVSDTRYLQNDNTMSSTLGDEDWQSYNSWGNSTGEDIIGLQPGTTYYLKAAARQGQFTQSAFGPASSVATDNPSLTFDIDVAAVDSETAPPFTIDFGTLTASTVTTANDKVWIDIDTNGTSGALIYVYGSNNGLLSSSIAKTISSASTNLNTANQGYGARSNSTSQTTGGPMRALAPYDGTAENVGILDTNKRLIFDSTDAPVSNGRTSFLLKAKVSAITEAAPDYSDVLTLIATSSY